MLTISCSTIPKQNNVFEKGNYYYFKKSNISKALKYYQQVPENSSDYNTALRYIGYNIYCRKLKKHSIGLPYLEKAYKLSPKDEKILEDLGRCYIEMGKIEEGKKLLLEANTEISKEYLKLKNIL